MKDFRIEMNDNKKFVFCQSNVLFLILMILLDRKSKVRRRKTIVPNHFFMLHCWVPCAIS